MQKASFTKTSWRCLKIWLKVREVKEIYEMKGVGRSIRGIAEDLGVARNTVRRYMKYPESMSPRPRGRRP